MAVAEALDNVNLTKELFHRFFRIVPESGTSPYTLQCILAEADLAQNSVHLPVAAAAQSTQHVKGQDLAWPEMPVIAVFQVQRLCQDYFLRLNESRLDGRLQEVW